MATVAGGMSSLEAGPGPLKATMKKPFRSLAIALTVTIASFQRCLPPSPAQNFKKNSFIAFVARTLHRQRTCTTQCFILAPKMPGTRCVAGNPECVVSYGVTSGNGSRIRTCVGCVRAARALVGGGTGLPSQSILTREGQHFQQQWWIEDGCWLPSTRTLSKRGRATVASMVARRTRAWPRIDGWHRLRWSTGRSDTGRPKPRRSSCPNRAQLTLPTGPPCCPARLERS